MENAENYLLITGTSEPYDDSEEVTAAAACGRKQSGASDTVIIGRTEGTNESDFRITSNVMIINADPDEIDGGDV